MPYTLALDLGTTSSSAAINDEVSGSVSRIFTQPNGATAIPSVVALGADGSWMVGDAAERHTTIDPTAVAREFKRRFGDDTPLLLRGTPVAANDLTLTLATSIVQTVIDQEGEPPTRLVVCHPANWGSYKISLLDDTLTNSGLPPHQVISEPHAAAIHYAGLERVGNDTTIAVYDLGGGTFDICLLTKTEDDWELAGRPGGIERLGGIDFDTALFHHVLNSVDVDLDGWSDQWINDEAVARHAAAALRESCRQAKHALSADTASTIAVDLPNVDGSDISTEVRITRQAFEELIDPAIARTLDVFDTTVAEAQLNPGIIDRVVLVGGSSQIPLIGQRLASHTGLTIVSDTHPKHAIVLGAAAALPETESASTEQVETERDGTEPSQAEPIASEEPIVLSAPIGSLFPDLPHISDGPEPEFLSRRRQQPTDLDPATPLPTPPPDAPPTPTPTPPTTRLPEQTAPPQPRPVADQVMLQNTTVERNGRRGSILLALLVLTAAVVGGGWVYLRQTAQPDESSETTASTENTATTTATSLPGDPCPTDEQPDATISYRVVEISPGDPDGGLNGREGPTTDTPPVLVFPSLSELDLTGRCALDNRSRPWWEARSEDGVGVWVFARLVEPVG